MAIYKINEINLNNPKTQLFVCYNKGVNVYSIKDYSLLFSSKTDENCSEEIANAALLYELNIIVFSGGEHNENYTSNKLVFYDLSKQEEIYSTFFNNSITDIKAITKYVLVTSSKEINIFSYSDLSSIIAIRTIPFENPDFLNYEAWLSSTQTESISEICLCFIEEKKNKVKIKKFLEKGFDFESDSEITTNYYSIQNVFYVSELNLLFIVDSMASYISSYKEDGTKQNDFYRGKKEGQVTSITNVGESYVAICNLNKTIHIFSLLNKPQGTLSGYLYSFVAPNLSYSVIKIKLDKIADDNNFYSSFFKKKGCLMHYSKETNTLNAICYNGYSYIIRINFLKQIYSVIKAIHFIDENLTSVGKSVNIDEGLSLSFYGKNGDIRPNLEENTWKMLCP